MTSPGRRWVWYGGRPSLDFVNTCRNREAGRADEVAEYLCGPADFAAWLHAAGLTLVTPAVPGETLAGALALARLPTPNLTAAPGGAPPAPPRP